VRSYWPSLLWAGVLLLIFIQSWWAMFVLRHYTDWTFLAFAIVLLQTIALYMMAAVVAAGDGGGGGSGLADPL